MSKGRQVITCIKCGKPQSTHSTNRDHCHACIPKCKSINTFPPKKAKETKETK